MERCAVDPNVPFGNGTLCIGGGVTRILPPAISNSAGAVSQPIDLGAPPFTSSGSLVLPGSTWHFQFWYRDPAGVPASFNLSNALVIEFAP